MKNINTILTLIFAGLLAGCSSTPDQEAVTRDALDVAIIYASEDNPEVAALLDKVGQKLVDDEEVTQEDIDEVVALIANADDLSSQDKAALRIVTRRILEYYKQTGDGKGVGESLVGF